jgi:hypothetical protein
MDKDMPEYDQDGQASRNQVKAGKEAKENSIRRLFMDNPEDREIIYNAIIQAIEDGSEHLNLGPVDLSACYEPSIFGLEKFFISILESHNMRLENPVMYSKLIDFVQKAMREIADES